jgi:acylphosphatase
VPDQGKISRPHADLTGTAASATGTRNVDLAEPERPWSLGDARILAFSARIRIYGKVQGVWFRGWIVREAAGHGLQGWVRNRTDGSVEALFAGDPMVVRQMIDGCHGGPPGARVDRVEEHPGSEPVPTGFEQLPTC